MAPEIDKLRSLLQQDKKEYQKRIMVRYGQHIKVFQVDDIAYFYSANKVNYLCTFDEQRVPVDQTLDELEKLLDHSKFFRLNRQLIVSFPSIQQMFSYPKAKIKVVLKPASDQPGMVSSERSAAFKEWLMGKA